MDKKQARIVLLEHALDEAINTIQFLDNCLTHPQFFSFEHPDYTRDRVKYFRTLVLPDPMCVHSKIALGCEPCRIRKIAHQELLEARRVLYKDDDEPPASYTPSEPLEAASRHVKVSDQISANAWRPAYEQEIAQLRQALRALIQWAEQQEQNEN